MPCARDPSRVGMLDRRGFLRLAGYGGVGLLAARVGVPLASTGVLDPSTVSRMEFDVSYRTVVHDLPSDAEDVQLWIPLPPTDAAQEIHDLTIESPLAYEIKKTSTYGNRLVHVQTGRRPTPFDVEVRYRVVRHRVGARRETLDAAAAAKYLRLTERVRVTNEVEAFAAQAMGEGGRPIDAARKAYDAIIDLLAYDKLIPGCGTGDTAWIMKHKRGKCDDYHALFMAMLVSRGIPVRWQQGFPLPYPSSADRVDAASGRLSGDCSGAHCWVSFYDPELGWVPVDVSEADKNPPMRGFFFGNLTPNRFQISEGRSIGLNPAQGFDPLSTFAFAYAEADGLPLIYPENYENIVTFTVTGVATSSESEGRAGGGSPEPG